MNKEEQIFRNRILELARLSEQSDISIHTDFLNVNEQTMFHSLVSLFPSVRYQLTGGYEQAERKIVCFLPSYEETLLSPPIVCLHLTPTHIKYADALTHRDYLGAIMNLGIDRCKVGDIVIDQANCYVMCMEDMSDYLSGELRTIKHTAVSCCVLPIMELNIQPNYETISGSVASMRLDSILALVYRMSRSKIVPYIEGERVFVNGKLTVSNSLLLKEGDIVSVRGLGKFAYRGVNNQTKKGRMFVTVDKYI